jgi:hypothetical protein
MSSKSERFFFKGYWYPTSFIKTEACKVTKIREDFIKTDDDLQEVIDAIMRGHPSVSAAFIVAVNEGAPK